MCTTFVRILREYKNLSGDTFVPSLVTYVFENGCRMYDWVFQFVSYCHELVIIVFSFMPIAYDFAVNIKIAW